MHKIQLMWVTEKQNLKESEEEILKETEQHFLRWYLFLVWKATKYSDNEWTMLYSKVHHNEILEH